MILNSKIEKKIINLLNNKIPDKVHGVIYTGAIWDKCIIFKIITTEEEYYLKITEAFKIIELMTMKQYRTLITGGIK